jgi:hypothetical protein
MTPDDNDPHRKRKLHQAMGEAMQAYADVEANLATVLGSLLKVNYQKGHVIFFSANNIRSRLELIEQLFDFHIKDNMREDFAKFWNSYSSYLITLASFRNAIAHWHPHLNIYLRRNSETGIEETRASAALGHPIIGRSEISLEADNIPPFLEDCKAINSVLNDLVVFAKRKPRSLPEKFRKVIPNQNQAVLRRPPPTKALQPRRPPSRPKLTKFEKRAKAEKEARERAKKR